jgi:hypothetical protein
VHLIALPLTIRISSVPYAPSLEEPSLHRAQSTISVASEAVVELVRGPEAAHALDRNPTRVLESVDIEMVDAIR